MQFGKIKSGGKSSVIHTYMYVIFLKYQIFISIYLYIYSTLPTSRTLYSKLAIFFFSYLLSNLLV